MKKRLMLHNIYNVNVHKWGNPSKKYTTYSDNTQYVVYSGRSRYSNILGNPFIATDRSVQAREEVIAKHKEYFYASPHIQKYLIQLLEKAKGRDLVFTCFCKPKSCHTDVYVEFLNNYLKENNMKIITTLPRYDVNNLSKTYAGIGSRTTPTNVMLYENKLARYLDQVKGYRLHTGDALGSDKAFGGRKQPFRKVNGKVTLWSSYTYIPENIRVYYPDDARGDVKAIEIAKTLHPNPSSLTEYALLLMARNAYQILGKNLDTPVDFVICWTKDGCEHWQTRTQATGGTGQAIELASRLDIPVINIANSNVNDRLLKLLQLGDKK